MIVQQWCASELTLKLCRRQAIVGVLRNSWGHVGQIETKSRAVPPEQRSRSGSSDPVSAA